jgi:hypothetical protein
MAREKFSKSAGSAHENLQISLDRIDLHRSRRLSASEKKSVPTNSKIEH